MNDPPFLKVSQKEKCYCAHLIMISNADTETPDVWLMQGTLIYLNQTFRFSL